MKTETIATQILNEKKAGLIEQALKPLLFEYDLALAEASEEFMCKRACPCKMITSDGYQNYSPALKSKIKSSIRAFNNY